MEKMADGKQGIYSAWPSQLAYFFQLQNIFGNLWAPNNLNSDTWKSMQSVTVCCPLILPVDTWDHYDPCHSSGWLLLCIQWTHSFWMVCIRWDAIYTTYLFDGYECGCYDCDSCLCDTVIWAGISFYQQERCELFWLSCTLTQHYMQSCMHMHHCLLWCLHAPYTSSILA